MKKAATLDPKANPIFQKVVKKFLATKPQPKVASKKGIKKKRDQ